MADQNRPGEIDDELLARFIAGEATDAERAEVERWAAEAPENNIELSIFRRLWDQSGSLPSPERLNTMWQSLQREMNEPEEPAIVAVPAVQAAAEEDRPVLASPPSVTTPRRVTRVRSVLIPIVVSVLLLIGVAVFWTARGGWLEREGLVLETARDVQTGRGERMRVQLMDGTQVDLGPESSLSIRYYAEGPREIKLTGEAIFDMTQDTARPFRVHSGQAVTEGLGTRFSVRAYPADPQVRVAVNGVVALRSAAAPEDSTAVLRVGQVARLTEEGRIEMDTVADAAGFLAWAQDRFVFQHVPLRRVAADLERWYDVAIQISNEEIAAERITVDVRARQLEDVLNAIAAPLDLHYERRSDTISFRP